MASKMPNYIISRKLMNFVFFSLFPVITFYPMSTIASLMIKYKILHFVKFSIQSLEKEISNSDNSFSFKGKHCFSGHISNFTEISVGKKEENNLLESNNHQHCTDECKQFINLFLI